MEISILRIFRVFVAKHLLPYRWKGSIQSMNKGLTLPVLLPLLLVALPWLAGCTAVMAVSAATEMRPDRKLVFDIEVKTQENKTLVFSGETECPHSVSIQGGGAYSTKTRFSQTESDGYRWMLYGIDCNSEIRGEKNTRYKLYKIVSDDRAKLFFVGPDEQAKVVKSTFESSVQAASPQPDTPFPSFDIGPYVYRKMYFDKLPAFLTERGSPIVACHSRRFCQENNDDTLFISKADFEAVIYRGQIKIVAIEYGTLDYDPDLKVWKPIPEHDRVEPMDVLKGVAFSTTEDSRSRNLINLRVKDSTYQVGNINGIKNLIVPSERAIYFIDYRLSILPQKNIHECPQPSDVLSFKAGTTYMTKNGNVTKYVRKKPDGSFWCSWTFF